MNMHQGVAEAINDQIQMEFQASYLYLAMSLWFDRQGLDGFRHWMRLQAEEEREHAYRLIEHMEDRASTVILRAISSPPSDFGSVREALDEVARHEARVTHAIHALYELAGQHKDLAAQEMLQWFIREQVEEEKSIADVLGRYGHVEAGVGGLLQLDRELGARKRD